MTAPQGPGRTPGSDDVARYLEARGALESSRAQVEVLEHSEPVESFNHQLDLLKRRLLTEPRAFRDMFIGEGMQAVAWEFQQPELGGEFIRSLWESLLRDDDSSTILMRFLWDLPLGKKRMFIRAIDTHLSERYPMFAGLSVDWPAQNGIQPYIREAEARTHDFGLVNQGYLGYMDLGYSRREVDLFVWLEVMRDKQCEEKPCELGVFLAEHREPKGGCPVSIHIPQVIDLIGKGRFRDALALMEGSNPLPDVTGRVCPQELQCQGVCLQKMPIAIGQLEWFLPEREKLVNPDADAARFAGHRNPWETAARPPVAIIGSGPSGLINAYLLSAEGFPVTVFEAFHALGGVLRYGIPEFRLPNELIDDVVGKIQLLGGRFVEELRRRQDRHAAGPAGRRLLAHLRRHRRGTAPVHEHPRRAPAQRHVGQRVPHPGEPHAGPAGGLRDTAAGHRRQGGAGHRRGQHRDGCRSHRAPARWRRHHRLPPDPEGDARARRGAGARP